MERTVERGPVIVTELEGDSMKDANKLRGQLIALLEEHGPVDLLRLSPIAGERGEVTRRSDRHGARASLTRL
jgi:hypothetical protein